MNSEDLRLDGEDGEKGVVRPKELPSDLPTSLNDRRPVRSYAGETEMYDGWQGQSEYLKASSMTSPLAFNLSLNEEPFPSDSFSHIAASDSRLMEMLATQAAHRTDEATAGDEEKILADDALSESDKTIILHRSLHMAASNGDVDRVKRLITGRAKLYIDLNAADEEGSAPIIYASCFGHHEVVTALLEAGAQIDRQDRNQWTALMWAITNRHKDIAKILLDHGASPDVKSSSGRTAFDFAAPHSEMANYLQESGYHMGDTGIGDDFYDSGFSQDRFEQEMEENEMKRRMMMESSRDLEVDLSSLGMDERPETPDDEYETEQQEFVWDRCLNDQMFVFQESQLDRILDIIITNMIPQRSPSQKPVPANILFLSARYAHYHANRELLNRLLLSAMDKINNKVERHQWDMTVLAFWISNATLLLHYLKKDTGLVQATTEFQLQLAELINEIFILIIRDAERRIDKVIDQAMLDHETIPGFEDVHFANEWNIFKSKKHVQPMEPLGVKPQVSINRAQTSPRNVTSLLSSTLFVLDLYDIHSVITSQILAQLYYWIGAELFNHILRQKAYLARTKAMQIRMNVSALEDWALANNRMPEHYENGSINATGEPTVEAARKHLTPVVQLLQWLQCFSSLGEDPDALQHTLDQLSCLTPKQLLHSTQQYRFEVGEKGLPKIHRKRLQTLDLDLKKRNEARQRRQTLARAQTDVSTNLQSQPQTPRLSSEAPSTPVSPAVTSPTNGTNAEDEDVVEPDQLFLNPAHMLQFHLPTTVDLRISYGAGYGGTNRERERKYIPTVPPDLLAKLDVGGNGNVSTKSDWRKQEWDD